MNELKKELSKLSGVDMFNPKYRDVFKKYFPDEKDAEEVALEEKGIEVDEVEEVEDTPETEIEEKVEDTTEEKIEEVEEIKDEAEDVKDVTEDAEIDDKVEDIQEASDEIVDEVKEDNNADAELLDAKIENELLKGGIRPEKLNPAKRVMKLEINSLDELDKVREILKEYPEWTQSYDNKGFGMSVDESGDGFTEEEKRLKQMGIDPR